MEVFATYLGWLALLISGVSILYFAIFSLKIIHRSKRADQQTGSSSGIYVEHGMVVSKDGKTVKPQHKNSVSYYESLL